MKVVNQVIKFPDLRPPKSREPIPELPPPSLYRLTSPTIIATDTFNQTKPPSRRRLFLWFAVAVALHGGLFLAIWLTPPLRIKWTPSPNDWVQVVSLPPPPATPVKAAEESPAVAKTPAPKVKGRPGNASARQTPKQPAVRPANPPEAANPAADIATRPDAANPP